MLTLLLALQAQNPLAHTVDPIRTYQNILHYEFAISIPDTGTAISVAATIHYRPETLDGALVLDLSDSLRVFRVWAGREETAFRHEGDSLVIQHWGAVGDSLVVTVTYGGRPPDGLFIQENVHGQRTAFADNWPNRAHFWIPVEDHPSDKASVSWDIEVRAGWKVVANGRLVDTTRSGAGRMIWRYREGHRIPAYTFVLGAGELTVTSLVTERGIRQGLWTYPEDSAYAVEQPFSRVNAIVDAFAEYVGAFPYDKLAHVQSSTRFGGMENSGAIFYAERGYANRSMGEGLVAHETAHQWFGDAVTEYDWHHLWLSEGFATYFAALFYQLIGDEDEFRRRMEAAKQGYLRSGVIDRPILDFAETNYMQLLNANNYPKGAWVLHMLRGEVGDRVFREGIREYYRLFRDSTALSQDLREVMERVSGRDLGRFFMQWLTQPGYPQLRVTVKRTEGQRNRGTVEIVQTQPDAWGSFTIPVRVAVSNSITGERASVTVRMTGRIGRGSLVIPEGADRIEVDPDGDVLLSAEVEWGDR